MVLLWACVIEGSVDFGARREDIGLAAYNCIINPVWLATGMDIRGSLSPVQRGVHRRQPYTGVREECNGCPSCFVAIGKLCVTADVWVIRGDPTITVDAAEDEVRMLDSL